MKHLAHQTSEQHPSYRLPQKEEGRSLKGLAPVQGRRGPMTPSKCPLSSLGIQYIRECALLCQASCLCWPGAHQKASVVWIGLTLTRQEVYGRTGGAA